MPDESLAGWLASMGEKESLRVVDLYMLAKDQYVHLEMKGSPSNPRRHAAMERGTQRPRRAGAL